MCRISRVPLRRKIIRRLEVGCRTDGDHMPQPEGIRAAVTSYCRCITDAVVEWFFRKGDIVEVEFLERADQVVRPARPAVPSAVCGRVTQVPVSV